MKYCLTVAANRESHAPEILATFCHRLDCIRLRPSVRHVTSRDMSLRRGGRVTVSRSNSPKALSAHSFNSIASSVRNRRRESLLSRRAAELATGVNGVGGFFHLLAAVLTQVLMTAHLERRLDQRVQQNPSVSWARLPRAGSSVMLPLALCHARRDRCARRSHRTYTLRNKTVAP
jgi:hypothetical protein